MVIELLKEEKREKNQKSEKKTITLLLRSTVTELVWFLNYCVIIKLRKEEKSQ